jgi:two-component system response regulator MtrA
MARILVCDDDPSVRSLLDITLSFDHEVTTVENGQEAVEYLAEHPDVQILLLDVMMPVLDGLATLRVLRANDATATLPVLMLTAKAMESDMQAGMLAGASAYLSKPFDPLEVETLVLELTGE